MPKHSPLKFIFGAAILALAMTGSLQATPEQDEVKSHLPPGVVLDNPAPGETIATNQQLADAVRAAIAHAHPQFSPEGLTGGGASLRPGAAHLIVEAAVNQAPVASQTAIINAAYDNSPIIGAADKPAVVAAITAGAICGAYSKPGATFTDRKVAAKSIVSQLVTKSLSIAVANTARGFKGVNLSSDPKMEKLDLKDGTSDDKGFATGPAGVATGAVSQVTGVLNNGADLTLEANRLVKTIVKTAVKAAPKQYLEIVQAAANAAARVYVLTGGTVPGYSAKTIKKSVAKILSAGKRAKAKIAINFGIAEANAGRNGAGAEGVNNYAFNNCNNQKVTDISGF